MDSKEKHKFIYQKYNTESILSTAHMKAMLALILDPGVGYWKSIVTACKLIVVGVVVFIMDRRREHELMMLDQKYQQDQVSSTEAQLEEDDLD